MNFEMELKSFTLSQQLHLAILKTNNTAQKEEK